MTSNRRDTLSVADLSVGDTLVHAETSSWGNLLHTFDVEVVRIVSNRVTLRHPYGQDDIALVVRDGMVTSKVYGKTSYRDRFDVYTPDDDQLAQLIERQRVEGLKSDAKRAVNAWQTNTSDYESARRAAEALTVWADAAVALEKGDAL